MQFGHYILYMEPTALPSLSFNLGTQWCFFVEHLWEPNEWVIFPKRLEKDNVLKASWMTPGNILLLKLLKHSTFPWFSLFIYSLMLPLFELRPLNQEHGTLLSKGWSDVPFKSNFEGHAALWYPVYNMKVVSTTLGPLPKMLPTFILPEASTRAWDRPYSNTLPAKNSRPISIMTKQDSNYDFQVLSNDVFLIGNIMLLAF